MIRSGEQATGERDPHCSSDHEAPLGGPQAHGRQAEHVGPSKKGPRDRPGSRGTDRRIERIPTALNTSFSYCFAHAQSTAMVVTFFAVPTGSPLCQVRALPTERANTSSQTSMPRSAGMRTSRSPFAPSPTTSTSGSLSNAFATRIAPAPHWLSIAASAPKARCGMTGSAVQVEALGETQMQGQTSRLLRHQQQAVHQVWYVTLP